MSLVFCVDYTHSNLKYYSLVRPVPCLKLIQLAESPSWAAVFRPLRRFFPSSSKKWILAAQRPKRAFAQAGPPPPRGHGDILMALPGVLASPPFTCRVSFRNFLGSVKMTGARRDCQRSFAATWVAHNYDRLPLE